MFKVTSACIWSVFSLSLLSHVSCSRNSECSNFSLSVVQARSCHCPTSLVGDPQRRHRQHIVAFVSGCKVAYETSTDRQLIISAVSSSNSNNSNKASPQKTMDFLKRIGKVGSAVTDTECLIGVDEGNAGGCAPTTTPITSTASNMKTLKDQRESSNLRSCIDTGIIDDMTHEFPYTNTGSKWGLFTDQVMGGVSTGNISREVCHGRNANVLRGEVSLKNNGGFIQMAANLAPTDAGAIDNNSFRAATPIDASKFTGIELEVHCDVADTFNVHLKTSDCGRPQISYRAPFDTLKQGTNGQWTSVRIPFSQFHGHSIDIPLDKSKLTRVGIVAIGREMQGVELAVSSIRLFKE